MKFDPSETIMDYELNHLFMSFCSFVTLTNTKKLNLANVFLLTLQNKKLREVLKTHCHLKNDFMVVKTFLHFDSSLYKSKYVMKFLNNNKNKIQI
jgi:hypothetical protein